MDNILIEALMFIICVLSVTLSIDGHNITISADCKTDYQLKDDNGTPVYNVSISILKGCPSETFSLMDRRDRLRQFSLYVVKDGSKRQLTLKWDHSLCTRDYMIGVRTTFHPNHLVHDNSQQCLRVKVRAVVSDASSRQVDKLHFNCFRIPSDIIGTLHVHKHTRGKTRKGCDSEQKATFNDYNIGCTFARTQLMLGGDCLDLRLLYVSNDVDLYRSRINIEGPDNWRHTDDLRNTYYVDKTERFIPLPVNEQGKYIVQVELLCNTNGEIGRRYFTLEKIVYDTCLDINSDPSAIPITSPTKPSYLHRNLAIMLVTLAVVVGLVIGTIIAVVYTKRHHNTRGRERRPDGTDEPLSNG